jgi:hypothetical protein
MRYKITDPHIKMHKHLKNRALLDYTLLIDDKFSIESSHFYINDDTTLAVNFYIKDLKNDKTYTLYSDIEDVMNPKFTDFENSDFEDDHVPLVILKNINRWIHLFYYNEKINKAKEYIKNLTEECVLKNDLMIKESVKKIIDFINIINKE